MLPFRPHCTAPAGSGVLRFQEPDCLGIVGRELCAALADFRDPFKDLPPVPTPAQTQAALDALQGGYEVLARLAPPPVDQQIRASLDALRAYDQFLAARSYDLVGLECADRAEHDRLEAAYQQQAGVVETQVKSACRSTSSTSTTTSS